MAALALLLVAWATAPFAGQAGRPGSAHARPSEPLGAGTGIDGMPDGPQAAGASFGSRTSTVSTRTAASPGHRPDARAYLVELAPPARLGALVRQDDPFPAWLPAAQDAVLAGLGPGEAELVHRYRHIPALALRTSAAAAARLRARPEVAAILPFPPLEAHLERSVPFVGADRVARRGMRGAGTTVVVMDSGVDAMHFDLRDAVVEEICAVSTPGFCGPAEHPAEDLHGHGTHVAGIVASRGVKAGDGVAPEASILALKLFHTPGATSEDGAGADFLAALELLVERDDLDALNMSFGFGGLHDGVCDDANAFTRAIHSLTTRLREQGVVSVASSGNDGEPRRMKAPACLSSVVSVGAVELPERGAATVAGFSNRSAALELLAPGVGIVSSTNDGKTGAKDGTSMAAPHVAGAVAVMRGAAPWAPAELIVRLLRENGQRPTVRLEGNEAVTLDVEKAVNALLDLTPTATPPPPTATPSPPPTDTPAASPTPMPSPSPTAEPPPPPIYLPAAQR